MRNVFVRYNTHTFVIFMLVGRVLLSFVAPAFASTNVSRYVILALDVSRSVDSTDAIRTLESLEDDGVQANEVQQVYLFAKEPYRVGVNLRGRTFKSISRIYRKCLARAECQDSDTRAMVDGWLISQKESNFAKLFNEIRREAGVEPLNARGKDNIILVVITDGMHVYSDSKSPSLQESLKGVEFLPSLVNGKKPRKPVFVVLIKVKVARRYDRRDVTEMYLDRTVHAMGRALGPRFFYMQPSHERLSQIFQLLNRPYYLAIDLAPTFDFSSSFIKYRVRTRNPFGLNIPFEYRVQCGSEITPWRNFVAPLGDTLCLLDSLAYSPDTVGPSAQPRRSLFVRRKSGNNKLLPIGKSDSTVVTFWSFVDSDILSLRALSFSSQSLNDEYLVKPEHDTARVALNFSNNTGRAVDVKCAVNILSQKYAERFSPHLISERLRIKPRRLQQGRLNFVLSPLKPDWESALVDQRLVARLSFLSATDQSGNQYSIGGQNNSTESNFVFTMVVPSWVKWHVYQVIKRLWFGQSIFFVIASVMTLLFFMMQGRFKESVRADSDEETIERQVGRQSLEVSRKFKMMMTNLVDFFNLRKAVERGFRNENAYKLFTVLLLVFCTYCFGLYLSFDLLEREAHMSSYTIQKTWLFALVSANGHLFIVSLRRYRAFIGIFFLAVISLLLNVV